MKKILIVGAGGFIGGHIAKQALERGYETWVGVRESTSMRYLDDPRLKVLKFDYDDPSQVEKTLLEAMPATERWDHIIYNLGATKCVNFLDFNRINYIYLRTFTDALQRARRVPGRFLYMSSLSAMGPIHETDGQPITGREVPLPNTRYGVSKIKAETHLETIPGFPYIIFRPTGVYGPHEKDYLMMVESIDKGWDFGVGYKPQQLTFIYVDDLVRAMFLALEGAPLRKKYIISEPRSYTQAEFRKIVAEELGRKWVIPVKLPMWMAWIASAVAEKEGVFRGKASTLNRDKYRIMRQRNWQCDTSSAKADFGFEAQIDLREGIRRTVAAYRSPK
ncbi:MAG: NAD(P)-dependent oxidoreductase [Bacteroidales bacterium]|nr:NAD(P)-dependent oxidoreductase [Bacteroidales bacterium]